MLLKRFVFSFLLVWAACGAAQAEVKTYGNGAIEVYSLKPQSENSPEDDLTDIEPQAGDIKPDVQENPVEWSGRVNLGAGLQTGNTEQNNINADGEVKAEWDKNRARLKAEISREKDEGELTEDNRKLRADYDRFFREQWFSNLNLELEQDEISNIDLRTVAGAGLGHQPYDSETLALRYVLGLAYVNEEFENGTSEDSVAGEWSLDYEQKLWEEALTAFHNHEILVPTDDAGAFIADTKTGLRVPIKDGLNTSLQVEFDWDNDPPPGVVEDDTKYTFNIGYEW